MREKKRSWNVLRKLCLRVVRGKRELNQVFFEVVRVFCFDRKGKFFIGYFYLVYVV